MGSFLSWAQAKSTQTNALISRLEHGDNALAVRMLSVFPIYAGINYLRMSLMASEKYSSEYTKNPMRYKNLGEIALFKAEYAPWYYDKFFNSMRHMTGTPTPHVALWPIAGLLTDLTEVTQEVMEGEYKEAAVDTFETLFPFGEDISKAAGWQADIRREQAKEARREDREKRYGTRTRPDYFEGGEISEDYPVSNAIQNPSKRKSKYLDNNPFDEPLARLGFTGGGLLEGVVDPLNRLGFTGGGLLVSVGVAPVSKKQISNFKKVLKKRETKREGGEIRQQYGLGRVVKALLRRKMGDEKYFNKNVGRKTGDEKYFDKDIGRKTGDEKYFGIEEKEKKVKAIKKVKESLDQYFDKERLIERIKKDEGYSSIAYKPDPKEKEYTIGWGFYGAKKDDTTTRKEADKKLVSEVDKRIKTLVKMLPQTKFYNKDLQDAIFSVHWRGDIEQGTKTRKLIQKGHYNEAAAEFLRHEEYDNAEALGIPGIRPRMERFSNELRRLHEIRGYVP
jgi:GH24 family phage-related lysozyme (muramidase)